jgi:hypothetical protein
MGVNLKNVLYYTLNKMEITPESEYIVALIVRYCDIYNLDSETGRYINQANPEDTKAGEELILKDFT